MTALSRDEKTLNVNPIDMMEDIVAANEWAHERMSDEEMVAGVGGQWCDYRLHFAWSDDLSALHEWSNLDTIHGATIVLANDSVLGHIHEPTGKVTRVGGLESCIGEALARAVSRDEVLQNR